MSSEPPISPDAIEPSVSQSVGTDAAASPARLSPKRAILNAAIVSLEYARQYLDKFLYWPDYILATQYYANVLALTESSENWNDAENRFKDVESWLQPGGKHRRFDEARKRIRAEAMYNRAVLLQRRGQTAEAKEQFQSVLKAIGEKREEPPRGVRFATEFALLMLAARDLGFVPAQEAAQVGQANTIQQISPERRDDVLTTEWQASAVPFLRNSRSELQLLEGDLDSAERDLSHLESKLEAIRTKLASTRKGKGSQATDYAKQYSEIESKRDDARARITKASKDLAVLRMMEAIVDKLQYAMPPSA
jgi:tetratricopeptide (TPR) repeat protein